MDEPPANWDQQEEETIPVSSTTFKLSGLNVNAIEFVPTFGTGLSFGSKAANVPTVPIPKTPPSTPVVVRHTNENEGNQNQSIPINTTQIESNAQQQQTKENISTREEDELMDDQNESLFPMIEKGKRSYFFYIKE